MEKGNAGLNQEEALRISAILSQRGLPPVTTDDGLALAQALLNQMTLNPTLPTGNANPPSPAASGACGSSIPADFSGNY